MCLFGEKKSPCDRACGHAPNSQAMPLIEELHLPLPQLPHFQVPENSFLFEADSLAVENVDTLQSLVKQSQSLAEAYSETAVTFEGLKVQLSGGKG